MSGFRALNILYDDAQHEVAEQTKELQAEEALKTFRQALKYHQEGDLDDSAEEYQLLLKLDVLRASLDLNANVPPIIKKLRYMVYKSYGSLVLDMLKISYPFLSNDEITSRLYKSLDAFSEALSNDSKEIYVWRLVSLIAQKLGNIHLSRFALESSLDSVSKNPNLLNINNPYNLPNPEALAALVQLNSLLSSISDQLSLSDPIFSNVNQIQLAPFLSLDYSFSWLDTFVPFNPNNNKKSTILNIDLNENTYLEIAKHLLQTDTEIINKALNSYFNKSYLFDDNNIWHHLLYNQNSYLITTVKCNPFKENNEKPIVHLSNSNKQVEPLKSSNFEKNISNTPSSFTDKVKPLITNPETREKRSLRLDQTEESTRSSKRVRVRSEIGTQDTEEYYLYNDMNMYIFSNLNASFDLDLFKPSSNDYECSDIRVKNFYNLLSEWCSRYSDIILKKPSTISLELKAYVLSLNINNLDNISDSNSLLKESLLNDSDLCKLFFEILNNNPHSLQEARILWIKLLFISQENSASYYTHKWNSKLKFIVNLFLDLFEDLLYNNLKDFLFQFQNNQISPSSQTTLADAINISLGIFELYVDDYIIANQYNKSLNSNKNKNAKKSATLIYQKKIRIKRWKILLSDLLAESYSSLNNNSINTDLIYLRFEWVVCFYNIENGYDKLYIQNMFQQFSKETEIILQDSILYFHNSTNIPDVSHKVALERLSKVDMSIIFENIFENSEDIGKNVELLEIILNPQEEKIQSINSEINIEYLNKIHDFINNSPLPLRAYLWNILTKYYEDSGNYKTAFIIYIDLIKNSLQEINLKTYLSLPEKKKKSCLLEFLYTMAQIYQQLTFLCLNEKNLLMEANDSLLISLINSCIEIITFLSAYINFDDRIANNTAKLPSVASYKTAAVRFKELILRSWYLLFCCCKSYLKRRDDFDIKKTILFLSSIHDFIGRRGYCWLANGIFLDLIKDELYDSNLSISETELLQCFHCRFGITISSENYKPFDHHAHHVKLNKDCALQLIDVIMRLSMQHKTIQGIPRSDFKSVLDTFCDLIGSPPRDDLDFKYNLDSINKYIEGPFPSETLKKSLKGELNIDCKTIKNNDYVRMSEIGLYATQGLIYLSQFRMRKKMNYTRSEDLDLAIKYFIDDLICSPGKFESWHGLASAYESKVNDDLTWNSDKIQYNNGETIHKTRKKCLLAYCMASNSVFTYANKTIPSIKLSNFWYDFANFLYSCGTPPLEGGTFKNGSFQENSIENDDKTDRTRYNDLSILESLKIVKELIQFSIDLNTKDWRNHYLYAKVLYKLDINHDEIITELLKSTEELSNQKISSSQDPIIEPYYKLISTLIKFVSKGILDPDKAISFLKKTSYYTAPPKDDNENTLENPKTVFFDTAVQYLLKLRNVDKRKWHHRPTYRYAKVLENHYGNIEKARDEILSFFSFKPGSKNFFTIWKPDNERPGKHFVFTSQYYVYLFSLYEKLKDIDSLMKIARRMRRMQSTMYNHTEVWKELVFTIIRVIRYLCKQIPEGYGDKSIAFVSYDEFMSKAQALESILSKLPVKHQYITLLEYSTEIRKTNNALAPTPPLEDVFVSIYMRLYADIEDLKKQVAVLEDKEKRKSSGEIDETKNSENGSTESGPVVLDKTLSALGNLLSTSGSTASTPVKSRTARITKKDVITRAHSLMKSAKSEVVKKEQTNGKSKTQGKGASSEAYPSSKKTDDKSIEKQGSKPANKNTPKPVSKTAPKNSSKTTKIQSKLFDKPLEKSIENTPDKPPEPTIGKTAENPLDKMDCKEDDANKS